LLREISDLRPNNQYILVRVSKLFPFGEDVGRIVEAMVVLRFGTACIREHIAQLGEGELRDTRD
jgi:hypothetical protein